MSDTKIKLDHALALAAEGYRVFPITPNAKTPPLIAEWQIAATRDEDQIRKWWSQWPTANIGCPADAYLDVDVDPRHGGDNTWAALELEHNGIPDTRTVKTPGGGTHHYFRRPEGVKLPQSLNNALGDGVDIKADAGGYVLGVGSTIDGKAYEWIDRRPPAMAPQWMINKIGTRRAKDPDAAQRKVEEDEVTIYRIEAFLNQQKPESVLEGNRDFTAYKVAATFYDFGATYATCLEYMTEWNQKCCVPPLSTDIVAEKARSAMTSRQSSIGSKHPTVLAAQWKDVQDEIMSEWEASMTPEAWRDHYRRQAQIDAMEDVANEKAREAAAARKGFPFTLARDITTKPKLYLVDGFIGAAEVSAIYGPPDGGKSTLAIDIGCHIAVGRLWCGRAVMKGSVLYIACERGPVVQRRVRAWCQWHNGGDRDIPFAVVSERIDIRNGLEDAEKIVATAQALAEACGLPVNFILLDTYNRALAGRDENSPKDTGSAIMAVDHVQRSTGAHVSLIHHTPVDRNDRLRGHTALLGAVDLTVRTGKHEDGILVEADKANDLPEKPRHAFRFESVDLECDNDDRTTSAPVLVPRATQPKLSGTRQKLSDKQTLALRALRDIAKDKAPADLNLPSGTRGATLEAWEQELISRNVVDADHRGRQAFERLQDALLTRSMIGRRDGRAWPLG